MRTFVPGSSVVHTHSFGGSVGSLNERTEGQSEVLLEDDLVKITAVLLRPQTSSVNEETSSKKSKNFDVFSAPVITVSDICESAPCRGRTFSSKSCIIVGLGQSATKMMQILFQFICMQVA
jgi:hypothetical protein